jgi:hypothetical protein
MQLNEEAAVVSAFDRGGRDALFEVDPVADPQPPRVADERPPAARSFALVERDSDPGVPPPPLDLRRDDLGVVEQKQVARPKKIGKLGNLMIRNPVALDEQQPGRIARPSRP